MSENKDGKESINNIGLRFKQNEKIDRSEVKKMDSHGQSVSMADMTEQTDF